MNIYERILQIRKELPTFEYDRTDGQVKFVSDEQMTKAIAPLMNKYNVIAIPHGIIVGDYFSLTLEFVAIPQEGQITNGAIDRFESNMAFPIDKRTFEFGATATLTEKYLYKMLFKIYTGEENGIQTPNSTTDSFEKITKKHGETKKEEIKPVIKMEDTQVYTNEEVVLPSPNPDEPDLTSLVNTVAATENLPEIKEEKKEEKKDPEVSDEKFNQVNEGWEVKVAREKCTDELTISKELDKAYTTQGVMIYAHPDMGRCPIHPRTIIDKLDARPSTKKVRDMLVQFRAWGEDAFWANATSVLGKSKEELLQIYTKEKPKEEPKEEPVTQPKTTSLKLDFVISEVNGEHRKMEDAFAISQGLNQMGITKWVIMAAIDKMELPEIDKNASPDDVISNFINTQSVKKIEEMIIIAQKLG